MKKQIPKGKRVLLLNGNVIVEGERSCKGIAVGDEIVLTLEESEATDGLGAEFSPSLGLLKKDSEGKYAKVANLDFQIERSGLIKLKMETAAVTGRQPIVGFVEGFGDVEVQIDPKKLTIEEILKRGHSFGWEIEFDCDGKDFRGKIQKVIYTEGKLKVKFWLTHTRKHESGRGRENEWIASRGLQEVVFWPTKIRELSKNKIFFYQNKEEEGSVFIKFEDGS